MNHLSACNEVENNFVNLGRRLVIHCEWLVSYGSYGDLSTHASFSPRPCWILNLLVTPDNFDLLTFSLCSLLV